MSAAKGNQGGILDVVLVAVLDACVLIPTRLRDVLLAAAEHELNRPLWSETIEAEVRSTLERLRPGSGPATDRMFARLADVFEGAVVQGWHPRVPGLMTPDPADRHVLATAMVGAADLITTVNIDDFPAFCLPPRIRVCHPDLFLCELAATQPDELLAALQDVARRGSCRVGNVLDDLSRAKHLAPTFAAEARQLLGPSPAAIHARTLPSGS
jgi:PIN domain